MDQNMENIVAAGEYTAAEKYTFSFRDKLAFWLNYIKMNLMILLLFIPETLRGIKNFILPPKPKSVKDQVALVTGGGNGLGRAIAFRLAKEKCKLAVVDVDFAAAQQTAQEISDTFNVSAVAFKVDVSKHEEITQLKSDVEKSLGPVDILVNNAGLLAINVSLREGSPEMVQKIVDVNLTSHFWTLRTFLDGMVERKRGHVVAICSMAGKMTFPCSIAYCATKFGVSGFMEALNDELGLLEQDFVKLTTAYPTFINTRKELGERLDSAGNIPRIEPSHAAHLIVKAVLRNRRNLYIPNFAKRSLVLNSCPDRIIKYVKANASDTSALKKERMTKT